MQRSACNAVHLRRPSVRHCLQPATNAEDKGQANGMSRPHTHTHAHRKATQPDNYGCVLGRGLNTHSEPVPLTAFIKTNTAKVRGHPLLKTDACHSIASPSLLSLSLWPKNNLIPCFTKTGERQKDVKTQQECKFTCYQAQEHQVSCLNMPLIKSSPPPASPLIQ